MNATLLILIVGSSCWGGIRRRAQQVSLFHVLSNRFGLVRFGLIRLGSIRFGSVPFRSVGFAPVRIGSVWFGSVRIRSVRFGPDRFVLFRSIYVYNT